MILAAHASLRRAVAAVFIVLAAAAPGAAHAQGAGGSPTVTNMTGAFHGGPYTSMSIYPGNAQRIAIGTASGHITWSEDGGVTALEAQVLVPRRFDPVTIRSGQRAQFSVLGETEIKDVEDSIRDQIQRDRIAPRPILHFIYLLGLGLPAGRLQIWMQTSDAIAELGDIAWPKGDGPMVIAAQAGLLVSCLLYTSDAADE